MAMRRTDLCRSSYNPVKLEVFKHLFASIADEMGIVLRKSSFSPNIKERRDFSCAIFNDQGDMIAQAAHIPVHLGSMPLSVKAAIQYFSTNERVRSDPTTTHKNIPVHCIGPGDTIILNDPYQGGTHLPDITLISPVYVCIDNNQYLLGYVANRAHHADIGGMSPGSMPIAQELFQEGLIIPPTKLIINDEMNSDIFNLILANVRTPRERAADLLAQISANKRGQLRLNEVLKRYSLTDITMAMQDLLSYTERITRKLISEIPDGTYNYIDYLDDDGFGNEKIPISVKVSIVGDQAIIDLSDSANQQPGSINAVYAITVSAVYYIFRCLLGLDVPNNSGCLAPINIIAPEGSVVNAMWPGSVAGGNVETSQRIVDVILGALSSACPERIPAASQGTMNNITIGGYNPKTDLPFTYYETIAGGIGARPDSHGISAMHSHMTNTQNTPIEALEYAYPFRIVRYEIRKGSGGAGKFHGGDGLRRDFQFLTDVKVTILSDRRIFPPYGLQSGDNGEKGKNILIRDGNEYPLPGKISLSIKSGDILSIQTPGGGGFGSIIPSDSG